MNAENTTAEPLRRYPALPAKTIGLIFLGLYLLIVTGNAKALEVREWRVQTSLLTRHWNPQPEHVNKSKVLNLELETTAKWIYGFAWFDNSFGQPSQYLYAGYSWKLFNSDWAYFKLTGGVLHGYKKPYENKIPYNKYGIAPAAVPTFGVKYKRVLAEVQILGNSAFTITAGFSFGRKSD